MIKIRKTGQDNQTSETDVIEKGCWIHLIDPSSTEIEQASESTGLDIEFLKAALDRKES